MVDKACCASWLNSHGDHALEGYVKYSGSIRGRSPDVKDVPGLLLTMCPTVQRHGSHTGGSVTRPAESVVQTPMRRSRISTASRSGY